MLCAFSSKMKPLSPVLNRQRLALNALGVQRSKVIRAIQLLLLVFLGVLLTMAMYTGNTHSNMVVDIKAAIEAATRQPHQSKYDIRGLKFSQLADEAGSLQGRVLSVQQDYAMYMQAHRYGKNLSRTDYEDVKFIDPKKRRDYSRKSLVHTHSETCQLHEAGLVTSANPAVRRYCHGNADLLGERVCDTKPSQPNYNEVSFEGFGIRTIYGRTFAYQPFFFRGSDWIDSSDNKAALKNKIAVCSQGTINRLEHLEHLVKVWKGPVSFSLLLDHKDQAEEVFALMHSQPLLMKHVAVHVVWRYDHHSNDTGAFYPINMLRNMAQQTNIFPWVFILDIDVTPNAPMKQYIKYLDVAIETQEENESCPGLHAYVPPAVEMNIDKFGEMYMKAHSSDTISKNQLIEAFLDGQALPMHIYFSPAYIPTNHYAWIFSDSVDRLQYLSRFEPYYLARHPIPLFNESFVNRGGNYAEQVFEMHVSGYDFYRLPDAFVVDIPHNTIMKEVESVVGKKDKKRKGDVIENTTKQLTHQEDFVVARWNDLIDWLPHRYGFNIPRPFDTAFRRYRRSQQAYVQSLWALLPKIGKTLSR